MGVILKVMIIVIWEVCIETLCMLSHGDFFSELGKLNRNHRAVTSRLFGTIKAKGDACYLPTYRRQEGGLCSEET